MEHAGYDALAEVYPWLVPDALLTPSGAAAALGGALGGLPPAARVLDCAAGTGELAVGLAATGLRVTASDASAGMVERARALAAVHGVSLEVRACRWDELPAHHPPATFDAVMCVGNSLTHAQGAPGRRTALEAMAHVLRPGGVLVVTSRAWEEVRAAGSRLEVGERVVVRGGRAGLVVRAWSIAPSWEERHELRVAVALLGQDGQVTSRDGQLEFWPFRRETLLEELRGAGLEPGGGPEVQTPGRYLVAARRRER